MSESEKSEHGSSGHRQPDQQFAGLEGFVEEGFEEAVLVFEPDASAVASQMRFSEFEALTSGAAVLEEFAASVAKAAYVVVGSPLAVRGICFFTFRVNEDGLVEPGFNLPLRYLIQNAGSGPDLGGGAIRLACRGQCPVPWHSMNLWEPNIESEPGAAVLVQKSIWRNRLGLKPTGTVSALVENDVVLEDEKIARHDLEVKLTETFGEQGKVNLQGLIRQQNDQLSKVSAKYRSDLEQQQQAYLDQIRTCRDEIQHLKAALRNEQQRGRRLQELLRGEP